MALLLPFSSAEAYGYNEHCRVSNHALSLALASWSSRDMAATFAKNGRELQAISRLISSAGHCSGKAGEKSYGDLVAQVDWALSPIDFYLGGSGSSEAARVYDSAGIPWDGIYRLRDVKLQSLRAMKENAEHFGARALLAFSLNHETAAELAARGKLGTALVMNAFADHYLEDHFAPGHIYTPRYGLNDMLAVSMHDRYNRVGAWYEATDVESLADVLSKVSLDNLSPDLKQLIANACIERKPADCIRDWHGQRIRLLGDDQLKLNPIAELYITLVIARSVLDIVDAYMTADASAAQAFGKPAWRDYAILPRFHWAAPEASLRFGHYAADTGFWTPAFDRSPTLSGGAIRYPAAAPGRWFAAVETPLMAWPGRWADGPSRLYARSTQPIVFVGLDAEGSCKRDHCPDFRIGPELRGLMPIARINSAIYVVAGDRHVSGITQGTHWAPHYGGGLEIGFGLLYLGVRLEGDRMVQNGVVGTYSRLTVSPTLSASIPFRRHRTALDSADHIVRVP